MEVLMILLFVGAVWVVAALAFFAWNLRGGAFDHADRLALLPLDDARSTKTARNQQVDTMERGRST